MALEGVRKRFKSKLVVDLSDSSSSSSSSFEDRESSSSLSDTLEKLSQHFEEQSNSQKHPEYAEEQLLLREKAITAKYHFVERKPSTSESTIRLGEDNHTKFDFSKQGNCC